LERDGNYWGPPADDVMAIAEVERQRRLGVSFLVFVTTTFWYFEYYRDFAKYLESQFNRVVSNERLVAFDLQSARGSTNENHRRDTAEAIVFDLRQQ
jgi:hypothetical protein